MKLLNFPKILQNYKYDCGARATQGILAYYGIDVREQVIVKYTKTNEQGTPLQKITQTLKKFGIKANLKQLTIDELKKQINKGNPIIIVIQAWAKNNHLDWKKDWKDGHYVVVIGYDKNRIYFEDPSSIFKTYLSIKELKERWHDIDIKGEKYINYGILVNSKKHNKKGLCQ